MARKSTQQQIAASNATIVEHPTPAVVVPVAETKQREKVSKRRFWKGAVHLGLINVPVGAVSMTNDKSVRLHWLERSTQTQIKMVKTNAGGKPLSPDEIVLGYYTSVVGKDGKTEGKWVTLEKSEIDSAKPESDRSISITGFVSMLSVDPIYFDDSYILTPDEQVDAYALLHAVLLRLGKAAIGKITMRNKEHPVLIHAYHGGLVMTTLRYMDEIVDPSQLTQLDDMPALSDDMVNLAMGIVDSLHADFDMSKFEDGARKKLLSLIDAKAKGEAPPAPAPVVKDTSGDLMTALKATLDGLKKVE